MRETALELRAHGYAEPARHALERALAWFSTRPPDEQASESHRFQLAQTLLAAGQPDPARALTENLARQHPRNVSYLGLLGVLAAQRHDQRYAERVDSLLDAVRGPYLRGLPTYWRAAIAAQLGEREMSVTLLRDATAQGLVEEFLASQGLFRGHSLHSDFYFEPLHGYPPFEQLLRPKG
jgi:predicted Zn-dependent protease